MQVVRLNPHRLATMVRPAQQVIALGFFDGVHQGHQRVIARARQLADEHHVRLAVMTFNRHASRVFATKRPTDFRYLNTIHQKMTLLAQNGVDTTYVVDFDRDFANLTPTEFVNDYLIALNARVVVGGFDYTFGRGGRAGISDMPHYNHHAFDVVTVAELDHAQAKIGSTRIRHLIKTGQITRANRLLGHPYAVAGQLVRNTQGSGYRLRPASRLQQLPAPGTYQVLLSAGQFRFSGRLHVRPGELVVTGPPAAMACFDVSQHLEVVLLKRQILSPVRRSVAQATVIRAIS